MATASVLAKQVKDGQALTDLQDQAFRTVNQLKTVKSNLAALKTKWQNDSDFTPADIAEIDAISAAIATEIGTI